MPQQAALGAVLAAPVDGKRAIPKPSVVGKTDRLEEGAPPVLHWFVEKRKRKQRWGRLGKLIRSSPSSYRGRRKSKKKENTEASSPRENNRKQETNLILLVIHRKLKHTSGVFLAVPEKEGIMCRERLGGMRDYNLERYLKITLQILGEMGYVVCVLVPPCEIRRVM